MPRVPWFKYEEFEWTVLLCILSASFGKQYFAGILVTAAVIKTAIPGGMGWGEEGAHDEGIMCHGCVDLIWRVVLFRLLHTFLTVNLSESATDGAEWRFVTGKQKSSWVCCCCQNCQQFWKVSFHLQLWVKYLENKSCECCIVASNIMAGKQPCWMRQRLVWPQEHSVSSNSLPIIICCLRSLSDITWYTAPKHGGSFFVRFILLHWYETWVISCKQIAWMWAES